MQIWKPIIPLLKFEMWRNNLHEQKTKYVEKINSLILTELFMFHACLRSRSKTFKTSKLILTYKSWEEIQLYRAFQGSGVPLPHSPQVKCCYVYISTQYLTNEWNALRAVWSSNLTVCSTMMLFWKIMINNISIIISVLFSWFEY